LAVAAVAIVCAGALVPVSALAQAPAGGWVNSQGHSPFVSVVAKVKDAVVNISAEKLVERNRNLQPFWGDWFGPQDTPRRQKSLGSGFVFRPDGYIVTNNHVINGADEITVRLSDKMELPATVVGTDEATDLALLKINAEHSLPYIPLGSSDSILVGDWVVAIGNPFPAQGLDRTVTVGVVSALGRNSLFFGDETPVYQDYIQTDASINPGNSGGPLVNLKGEVIGINSAIASPTGSNVGIGFAIPVNFVKSIIPDLLASGTVSRGWLGIQPRSLSWDDVEAEGLSSADGVIVDRVIAGTPAEQAGLRVGDVILSVDGAKVNDAQHFMQKIWQARAGATISLGLLRRGHERTVDVTLGDRNIQFAASQQNPDGGSSALEPMWLGMNVSTATAELADQYGSEYHPGVIVTGIDPDGPAYEKGIRVGMIIAEIDQAAIRDHDEFQDAIARLEGETRAVSLLVFQQNGQTGYITVRPEWRE
jgi:Do/DeqQ family serine protease